MPTKVGIHCGAKKKYLDSRFRGNDKLSQPPVFELSIFFCTFNDRADEFISYSSAGVFAFITDNSCLPI
jgi:hypothetical protein